MSRRRQIEMNAEEVRDFLSGAPTIIITSINRDGTPHPVPMWFAVQPDGTVVMTTYAKSQKIRNLDRDPRVSLLVEAGETYAELRGVVLSGRAELLRDPEAIVDILIAVSTKQGAVAGALDRSQMLERAKKRVAIRVRPERVVSWDHRKLGGAY